MTGIELAADSCVLVDVRRGDGVPRLTAVHVVEPSEWPAQDLARVRRRKRFAAPAHVVAWTANEAALGTLAEAGFVVQSVISPEQALGLLAADRARPQSGAATAWLALSRHGAALAIVRGQQVLYSRRIAWRYRTVSRLNEQLLQRYSFVAHLAPELQRGIDLVRKAHGISVDGAVTCGDLPDLRSLTMPLIEELDLEVETLDSLDGLDAAPSALASRAAEYAPALRLASAVTSLPPVQGLRRSRWWGRAAAALVLVAAGWWTVSRLPVASEPPAAQRVTPPSPSPTATSGSSADAPVVPLIPQPEISRRRQVPSATPEPLPAVSSILFGRERRLAILNGAIVGEGDTVGQRRVTRIERDGVVLRDPSGAEVRVGVPRPKQPREP